MRKHGLTVDNEEPDIVVSVGGDGTLLGAFQHYVNQIDHVRFVGLHTGHLGFYTDWLSTELDQLVDSLSHDNGQKVSYPLLELTVIQTTGEKSHYLALNEAVIKQPLGTLVADIYLGGEVFDCYKFRSMRPNKEADKLQAVANDPRVTKVGAFMRKTNIDELRLMINNSISNELVI